MVQKSLVPIRIVQQMPSNHGTADLKAIGLGDDGFEYALKRLEDNPLLPICEWMGYHLSRAIGLFTPDFAPVWLDEETPAFGSRWEQTAQIGVPINPVEIARFFGADMRLLTEPIFAVDAFLPNEDRHARNFMWRSIAVGPVPLAFDFSRAWLLTGLPFGDMPMVEGTATFLTWQYLKGQFGYQAPVQAIQKIADLPEDWLARVFNEAPKQWLAGFDSEPTINFWKHQRRKRCIQALSLL